MAARTGRSTFPKPAPGSSAAPFGACENSPSPKWLQDRLTSIGLRPINALVDVTNFFTFDLGRPLHVFDVAKLTGDVLTLRRGAGETLRALNGKDYVVDPEDCAICDAAGVQSIAGVIGGEATGCDETTTTVFIECALFDPVRIALTGRRHQIVSDARQRFERGLDPALMPDAIEAATAHDPGTVRRRAWHRHRRRRGTGLATRRHHALLPHRRLRRIRHSAGRSGCLAGTAGLRRARHATRTK